MGSSELWTPNCAVWGNCECACPGLRRARGVQDIDAAYLFQDIGDIDDDLSSLLVPDLDFSGINDIYPAAVKKPAPVQTGKGHARID